jgi:hypothetical protein
MLHATRLWKKINGYTVLPVILKQVSVVTYKSKVKVASLFEPDKRVCTYGGIASLRHWFEVNGNLYPSTDLFSRKNTIVFCGLLYYEIGHRLGRMIKNKNLCSRTD